MKDVGVQAASKSTGLVELASKLEQNAERDCHQLIQTKFELSLPIPRSIMRVETDSGTELEIPVLRLQDWMKFILDGNHSHMLVGLDQPNWARESDILAAFWGNYRVHEPTHPVFSSQLDLRKTFPMILHGDEGRGRRRTAHLVVNCHSILGAGLRRSSKRTKKNRYIQMLPNYAKHSLTTRLMLASLPKALYTFRNEAVWHSLMQLISDQVQFVFSHGVMDDVHGRGNFHMAVIFVAGDWPWLADSGNLLRSFRNVPKHKTRRKAPVGICHLCQAGQVGVDFEEIHHDNPTWLHTMFSQELCEEGWESPLLAIPHPPGKVGSLFAFDVFHTWHLGVARSFLASFLALLSELQGEGSIDDRFDSMTVLYLDYCKLKKKRAHVTKLSKELIGYPTTSTYPQGGWHKADLSTSLMGWVVWRYEREGHNWSPMLKVAGMAGQRANNFLRILYNSEAWLTVDQATKAGSEGLDFLKKYATLCKMGLNEKRTLWVLQPKMHALHHLVLSLLQGSQKGPVLNLLTYATQQDEDFIGRPSRLARRVTAQPIACCHRVLDRYLEISYSEWVGRGLIVRPVAGAAG